LATKKVTYLAPTTIVMPVQFGRRTACRSRLFASPESKFKRPLIPEFPRPWALFVSDAQSGEGRELFSSGNAMEDSLPLFAFESLKFTNDGRIISPARKTDGTTFTRSPLPVELLSS